MKWYITDKIHDCRYYPVKLAFVKAASMTLARRRLMQYIGNKSCYSNLTRIEFPFTIKHKNNHRTVFHSPKQYAEWAYNRSSKGGARTTALILHNESDKLGHKAEYLPFINLELSGYNYNE